MSVVYSHYSDEPIDTDKHEVVELEDGDYIRADRDADLLDAWNDELITDEKMIELGFSEEQLYYGYYRRDLDNGTSD